MTSSPKQFLACDSSRIQLQLSQKIFSNSTFESLHPSGLKSVAEKSSQMINRRLKHRRHPLSGMQAMMPEMIDHFTSNPDFFAEDNKTAHRLNSRILETWINNTISDASSLNIPGQVLKEDSKLPLMRFGIDRTALLKTGMQAQEVDRLYRSLFVYSIGFYQLIQKILEHTNKKYTIVTGVWKVYAILLEYCCQLDYQMIITTLNLEKREEIEQLESDYQAQISKIENHEKELEESVLAAKEQLEEMQKELHVEIYKREEIEDELMRRGNGHEEEVAMRLQFESKLNQMYAKMRDLQTKLEVLNENMHELQKSNHERTEQLQKERYRNNELIKRRTEAEQEMKKFEEIYKQTENLNTNLEKKLTETYSTIETLSINLSNLNAVYNETLNELAQKKIEVDDLKFSIEIIQGKLQKEEAQVTELQAEKILQFDRILELEKSFNDEVASNQHYKQEFYRIKELESVMNIDLSKYMKRCNEQEFSIEEVTKQRDYAMIQLDGKTVLCDELKVNLKDAQNKLEEMNKGRRAVEEQNKTLKMRIEEVSKEASEGKLQIRNLKDDVERYKSKESEHEFEINELRIKLQSVQKQFSTTKETLDEKISNLTEILESEKKIRENWIYRYEDEQRVHSSVTKELILTHDKLNEATIRISHLESSLEESNFQRSKLSESHKEDLEQIMVLKFSNEDYKRKNKTLQLLIENIDNDFKLRQDEIQKDHEKKMELNSESLNIIHMKNEDTWVQALNNYQEAFEVKLENKKYKQNLRNTEQKLSELEIKNMKTLEEVEGRGLLLEDSRASILNLQQTIGILQSDIKGLENNVKKSQKALQDFRNLAPPEVRNAPNPFRLLMNQIQELKNSIEKIETSKPVLAEFGMQWNEPLPDRVDNEMQTDKVEENFVEKKSREKKLDERKNSLRSNSSNGKKSYTGSGIGSYKNSERGSAGYAHFPLKKKSTQEFDIDSEHYEKNFEDSVLHHDEERVTPLNLKSIYSKDQSESLISSKSPNKLPQINQNKRNIQVSPLIHTPSPVPTLPSADFKRALKQAVSRRRNNE